ncbi:MAG TPA: DMT family transporter [Jatrophihabitantaceae bacterium]
MTVVLGLLAAMFYGTSDFLGGLASRSRNAVTVLLYAYPVGAVLMTAMLPFYSGSLTAHAALFGVLGGTAGLIGVTALYHVMTIAPMNIVSPVSAVLAAMVPVVFGVAIGERPSVAAWLGIACGIFAVVLVSRTTDDHPLGRVSTKALLLACLSGVGFGLYFIFLARAGHDSGVWPLVISRYASAVLIVPLALARGAFVVVTGRTLVFAVVAGVFDALANLFFLLATRSGLLSLASVLTALYPAFTVMLAVGLLREHVSRVQLAGFALAASSVVLITV